MLNLHLHNSLNVPSDSVLEPLKKVLRGIRNKRKSRWQRKRNGPRGRIKGGTEKVACFEIAIGDTSRLGIEGISYSQSCTFDTFRGILLAIFRMNRGKREKEKKTREHWENTVINDGKLAREEIEERGAWKVSSPAKRCTWPILSEN